MIELRSAIESSVPELAALQASTTLDYPFPISGDPREFARRLAVDAIDLGASWIATYKKRDVGVALLARRGGFARIDMLGVVPDMRRQGVAGSLIDAVMAGGRVHGDVKVIVEVAESSEIALRLYQEAGFHTWRRLVGWERNHPNVLSREPSRTVSELALRHAAWACTRNAEKDLPWMFAPESIANLTSPYRAFEHDKNAYCIVKLSDEGVMKVRALVVRTEHRRRGLGSAVLAGAVQALGAKRVIVPPSCPDRIFDGFFTACGFEKSRVAQLELRRPFEKATRNA